MSVRDTGAPQHRGAAVRAVAMLFCLLVALFTIGAAGCGGLAASSASISGSDAAASQDSGASISSAATDPSSNSSGASSAEASSPRASTDSPSAFSADTSDSVRGTEPAISLDRDGWYYSLEDVVLYLDAYGELPDNFITKSAAKKLGWQGGSVEGYQEGAAIGGDKFENYEGLLPTLSKGVYRECDIDTLGADKRGAKRLIYTDDDDSSNGCAPYYYTDDHYETFTLVEVIDGAVMLAAQDF